MEPERIDQKWRRINGFSKPLNTMQILTWVFYAILFIQYLALVAPHALLPSPVGLIMTIIFVISGFFTAYSVYKTCSVDSIDELLLRKLLRGEGLPEAMESESEISMNNHDKKIPPIPEGETKYCWNCETRVHELSMHCKYCQKCVSRFDHHCQWLNTCVGRHNYSYFVNTLYSITVFCVMNFVGCSIIVIRFWNGSGKGYYDSGGSTTGGMATIILLMCFMLMLTICLLLIGQLLLFHLKLKSKGITTYEFIVTDNHKKRELSTVRYELAQSGDISMWQIQCAKRGCLPLCMDPARKKFSEREKRIEEQKKAEELSVAVDNAHNNKISFSSLDEKKNLDDAHILPVASTASHSKDDSDHHYDLVNKEVDVELAVILDEEDQGDGQEMSFRGTNSQNKEPRKTSFLSLPKHEENLGNGKENVILSPKNNIIAALGNELDRFTADERRDFQITLSPTTSTLDQSIASKKDHRNNGVI